MPQGEGRIAPSYAFRSATSMAQVSVPKTEVPKLDVSKAEVPKIAVLEKKKKEN